MNNFSEYSQSNSIFINQFSEYQKSSKNSNRYISLSKELNIPITSLNSQINTTKKKTVNLYDSHVFTEDLFHNQSFSTARNEEDILSKLMKLDNMQINTKDYEKSFNKRYNQNHQKEYIRDKNAKMMQLKSEPQKFFLQSKTKTLDLKQIGLSNINCQETKRDDFNPFQYEFVDPQTFKKNDQELEKYIIKEREKPHRILPKIKTQENNKKVNNELNTVNRQRRYYSLIDKSYLPNFEDQEEKIEENIQYQVFRKRKAYYKKSKLRIWLFFVLAIIRISKKYITQLKERASGINNLDQKKIIHQKYVDQYGIKNLQYQQKAFVDGIFSKLNSIFQDRKYVKECEEIQRLDESKQKDLKKQRFCQIVSFFFQTLEIVTRAHVIPKLIVHLLNLNFFKTSETKSSLFVINRARYYTKFQYQMNKDQQLIIASEYLLFSLMIPQIFETYQSQKSKDQYHHNASLSYLSALTELIQLYFVNQFKGIDKIKDGNVRPVQRLYKLEVDENSGLAKTEVILNSTINQDETRIIENGFDRQTIIDLIASKPYWDEKMKSKFAKIISNIEKLIMINHD